ncbi:MAG: LexA family transcriptional regulator [Rubrivivax sp.]|nr:LexA family transcriptional regulator [Rubrivivax sp.]
MESENSVGSRLRTERERLHLKQDEVAEVVRRWGAKGVTRQSVSAYEAGRRIPDAHYLEAVASLGVDVQYVVTGKRSTSSPDFVARGPSGAPLVLEAKDSGAHYAVDPAGWVVVPRLDVAVSAGSADRLAATPEERLGTLAFSRAWMRERFGRAGDGFATVQVVGDSMEPTLLDGDEIVVDLQARDHARRDGLYVIALDGDLRVKRLRRRMDGSAEVWGDNPAYRPEVLPPHLADELRVIGRVVWPRIR